MLQYIKPDTQIDFESYEKNLSNTKVFNDDDDEDEGDLVPKNSILK